MIRSGTVLVVALLAVLAMELVALSAFSFARIAGLGATSSREHLVLQLTADDVLAGGVASLEAFDIAARSVGVPWSIATPITAPLNGNATLTGVRAADDVVVLTAEVRSGRGVHVRSRGLLRIVRSVSVLQGFPAVVTTNLPTAPSAVVEATDTASCSGPAASLPPSALLPFTTRSWADSLVFGDAAGLGWQDAEVLAAGGPEPIEPDSARLLLVSTDSAITGTVRGIIVAQGDLRLAPGAEIRGLMSVKGELTVESGATVRGAVRALALQDLGGGFFYDRCAVVQALEVPPLRRVYRAGTRWRVPTFD